MIKGLISANKNKMIKGFIIPNKNNDLEKIQARRQKYQSYKV